MSRPFPSVPVLSVSVLCHKDGSALLIKRGKPPYKDHWSLPGGKVEFGETLAEAAARELREETELTAELAGPVEVFDSIQRDETGNILSHFVLAVFVAANPSGTVKAGDDATAAEWVALEDLDGRITTPGTPARIRRLLSKLS
ncbi:NUDIX hydrolase [Labrenzia sp. R4_1]|uniref:NUDIX hydrolase n=1 Tax=Labrenzia sp. R4_1 TaxID=2821106 RepID=UPI001ADC0BD7|nr:NUDIX hydrolase [Labrenzia sp. R4_1]MBO9423901.1 NUDIX hydrolase [Labrenzia sp. R4_1]